MLWRAAGIVSLAFLISRAVGVVRDAVINYYFGVVSLEATAFITASRIPDTIFYVIAGGALGSAFIPTFAAYFVRDDAAGGWRLFAAVLNLVTLVTTIISGLAAVFAPQIVTFFLADLLVEEPDLLPLTVRLLRVMLLSPILFGASGVIMGALNARQHFLLPAVAPIVYNLGIIAGAIVLAPNVMGLAIGTVVGAAGHLLIQWPGLAREKAHYKPILSLRDAGVRQVLRLMAPRLLGLSFGQVNHLVTTYLAQTMTIGSIPALAYAWRIMIMPQGILGQAMGIAAFPTLSTLAARSALADMRRLLADSLRLIAFLSIPASVLLVILRRPVVSLLFERGNFGRDSAELVAWALLFYTLGLGGLAALEIVARAYYALADTTTPVLAGGLQLLGMAGLGLWLSQWLFRRLGWLEVGGLALAHSLSTYLEVAVLLWWLRGKMGGVGGRRLGDGLWRMGAAGLLMTLVAWFTQQKLTAVGPLWQLAVVLLVGGGTYLLACLGLGVDELRQVAATGRRLIPHATDKQRING